MLEEQSIYKNLNLLKSYHENVKFLFLILQKLNKIENMNEKELKELALLYGLKSGDMVRLFLLKKEIIKNQFTTNQRLFTN